MENAFINVKGVRHTITAEVELSDAKTEGVIIAQAGYFGGWALYMKGGQGRTTSTTSSGSSAHERRRRSRRSRPASTRSSTSSSPTRRSPAPAASRSSASTAQVVAEGHIPKTQPFVFSADEGVDVGMDIETNVSPDYKPGDNAFTGKIVKVTVAQL